MSSNQRAVRRRDNSELRLNFFGGKKAFSPWAIVLTGLAADLGGRQRSVNRSAKLVQRKIDAEKNDQSDEQNAEEYGSDGPEIL